VHFCPAPNVSTKCQGLSDGHLKTDSIEKGITETPMGNLPLSDSYYHVTFNDGRAIFRPPSLSLTARISTRLRQTANVAAIRELACRPNRLGKPDRVNHSEEEGIIFDQYVYLNKNRFVYLRNGVVISIEAIAARS
jgi:hypothetical protein